MTGQRRQGRDGRALSDPEPSGTGHGNDEARQPSEVSVEDEAIERDCNRPLSRVGSSWNSADVQAARIPCMTSRLVLVLAVLSACCRPAIASDTELSGGEGHPRARFPLTIHAQRLGEPLLDGAVGRAVDDWDAVSRATLGIQAFRWVERREEAQVIVELEAATAPRMMGVTYVGADDAGVVTPPVRIVVFAPAARGQTSRETVLYQVVAHELGHALGLAHARDPRSLMCCAPESVDFNDPATRDAYVQARRHPDLWTVRTQLRDHYTRFWDKPG
jgi:hypothetical protein